MAITKKERERKYKLFKDYLSEHPKATWKELEEKTGVSRTFIRLNKGKALREIKEAKNSFRNKEEHLPVPEKKINEVKEESMPETDKILEEIKKTLSQGLKSLRSDLEETKKITSERINELSNKFKSLSPTPNPAQKKQSSQEVSFDLDTLVEKTSKAVMHMIEEREKERQRIEEQEKRKLQEEKFREQMTKIAEEFPKLKEEMGHLVKMCDPNDPECLNWVKQSLERIEKEKKPKKTEVKIPTGSPSTEVGQKPLTVGKKWPEMSEEEKETLIGELNKYPHPALYETLKNCPECYEAMLRRPEIKNRIMKSLSNDELVSLFSTCTGPECKDLHQELLKRGIRLEMKDEKGKWIPLTEEEKKEEEKKEGPHF